MDDPAQNSHDQTQESQQPIQEVPKSQKHGVKPSGGFSVQKEHDPISPTIKGEYLAPAPHEAVPAVSEEVVKHVEVVGDHETPQLSDEDRKLGLQEAKESTPVPKAPSESTRSFPLTSDQIKQSESSKYSIWDSFKWFGALVHRQVKRAHRMLFAKTTS